MKLELNKIAGAFATASLCATMLSGQALAEDKVVHVYSWAGYLPQTALDAFTKESGMKVEVTPYESVEAPETKLMTGSSGFDLVLTAGFTVPRLIKAGALDEFDHSKVPNLANLDQKYLETKLSKIDPGVKFSVPIDMGVTAVAVNEDKVHAILGKDFPLDSLNLLFDPVISAKLKDCGISFLDSPMEVTGLAFLYNHAADQYRPTKEDIAKASLAIKTVVPNAKYFDNVKYVQDLSTGSLCVSMAWNNDVLRATKMSMDAGATQNLKMIYPKEGALLWSDHLVIPKDAPNKDGGIALMNYLLRGDSAAAFTNGIALATVNTAGKDLIEPQFKDNVGVYPPTAWIDSIKNPETFTQDMFRDVTRAYARAKSGS